MGVPKYRNQLTTNIQELTDNNTMTGDFNTHLWQWTDRLYRKSKGNNSLDTLDHRDSTDIVWTFLPKAEYTFLSSAHGTFSRTDHIMAHKSALNRYNRYKKVDITPCTFSTTTLWNSKSTVRKNLDRPKIRGDYEHPTREWMEQPGN